MFKALLGIHYHQKTSKREGLGRDAENWWKIKIAQSTLEEAMNTMPENARVLPEVVKY